MNNTKTAIVTGAGSGIGRETAIQLANAGFRLALVGRTRSKLEQTAQLIDREPPANGKCTIIPVDLCDARAVRRMITDRVGQWGRIDAIANIAGDAPLLSIEQVTPEIWERCIHTNLSAIVHLVSAAWPTLRGQKDAVIVNVSSMASTDPFPGFSIYAASKAAVNMLTQALAQEGEECGIRTVAVAPDAVETPMLRALFDEQAIPRNSTLSPTHVANVISECMTGSRSFKSGETIFMPNSP